MFSVWEGVPFILVFFPFSLFPTLDNPHLEEAGTFLGTCFVVYVPDSSPNSGYLVFTSVSSAAFLWLMSVVALFCICRPHQACIPWSWGGGAGAPDWRPPRCGASGGKGTCRHYCPVLGGSPQNALCLAFLVCALLSVLLEAIR